jgi:hypothetical protein
MTQTQFRRCITYTVEQMKGKSNRACYATEAALQAAMDPTILYVKFEDMPLLCWDVELGEVPSLKTGQHRRWALMQKSSIKDVPYDVSKQITEPNKTVSSPFAQLISRSI